MINQNKLNSPDEKPGPDKARTEDRLSYLTMLLDTTSDAIISFDTNKIITFWNKGAERIYGWTSSEALGKDSAVLFQSEAPEAVRDERLEKASKLGDLLVEAVHYTKDNKRIIIESHVMPVKDQLGMVTGYTAVNRDITLRKKTEEELQESQRRYRSLFNNKTNGIAHCRTVTDENGKPVDYEILQVNEAYTDITGIKKEDIEGRLAREVFPGIEHFTFDYIGQYGKVALEGGELNFEAFFEALSQWLSIYVYSPKKGEFTAIFTDVSKRKHAEEALIENRAQLLDVQKLAHVGGFSYNLQTGKIEWTEETFNIYEQDPQKDVQSFEVITGFWHPEDYSWIAEAIKDGMDNNHLINFECRLLLPGDKVKYVNYIGRPVYNSQGKPIKRVGALLDITGRKLQELELRKTLEELQRSNKDLEQFAYVASHDLQEPLRMVSAYTRLLEKQFSDKLDEKSSQYVYFIIDGAKRMHLLIQDLLAYSRVASKKNPPVPTDLNITMTEILRDFQLAIADHHAEIEFQKMPVINADPMQIRQVFQNLIQNAIKFRGNENPLIQINAQKNGREWIISVKDNGIGISSEFHERIFEIFQRLHEREKYPGTGIGLAICKKIIEFHGGRIWVESSEGCGSTFFFTLPANGK